MQAGTQTTLRRIAKLAGIGIHSGQAVEVTLRPAAGGSGITFIRLDQDDREIAAAHHRVVGTDCATVLGDGEGATVSTVEHVLAALSGLGVDNAIIELNGPELPIMDGSADRFVAAIEQAGIAQLSAPRRYLKVLRTVGVIAGDSYGELRPYDGFRLEVEIDFSHSMVGRQALALDVTPSAFRRQLARARTFGFTEDVERLWHAGYAHGASLANTLVIGGDRVLNPEGLRFKDEYVRHKALDAVGDLALVGAPILGAYKSVRGGHRLNYAVLSALLADQSAWTYVEAPAAEVAVRDVPVLVDPVMVDPVMVPEQRRERVSRPGAGRGDGALVQPAFGPPVT